MNQYLLLSLLGLTFGAGAMDSSRSSKTTASELLQRSDIRALSHQLMQAIAEGRSDVVDLLFQSKHLDVNLVDGTQTPLTLAIAFRHNEIARKLVKRGANVNTPNMTFAYVKAPNPEILMTPLHMAANGGNSDMVEFLLQQSDIQVNPRDNLDSTPLDNVLSYQKSCQYNEEETKEMARIEALLRAAGGKAPKHENTSSK